MRPPRYDLVVTSSHAFARYFPTRDAIHLCYVYAPMRYAWTPEIDGRGSGRLLAPARSMLRYLDRRSVPRVHSFAAISTAVAERIRTFYRREARVIFPPVDTAKFLPGDPGQRGEFLLGISRWIPYKRLDLVIQVGEQLHRPVVIAGRGPLRRELLVLARKATVPVRVVESPSDEELNELYRTCRALIFPPLEDFGIVPIEAQACGTPVVALNIGGSRDTVINGETGALSETQDLHGFVDATLRCLELGDVTDACVRHATSFSSEQFSQSFRDWVSETLEGHLH